MSYSLVIGTALSIIDKLFPNATDAANAKMKVLEMEHNGELAALDADLKLALGQMEINREEASSTDWFRAGWRPFIGWCCGGAFAFNFMLIPLLVTLTSINGTPVVLEPLDMTEMMPVLLGMLGLGGFRTYERIKNKA